MTSVRTGIWFWGHLAFSPPLKLCLVVASSDELVPSSDEVVVSSDEVVASSDDLVASTRNEIQNATTQHHTHSHHPRRPWHHTTAKEMDPQIVVIAWAKKSPP